MVQKFAAIAAVMISLISVLAGVSVMSGDVNATVDDSLSEFDGYNVVEVDYSDSSSGGYHTDFSFVDGNFVVALGVGSTRLAFYDFSVESITFNCQGSQHIGYFYYELTDLFGSPLDADDIGLEVTYADDDSSNVIGYTIHPGNHSFYFSHRMTSPGGITYYDDVVFIQPEDSGHLTLDLAKGFVHFSDFQFFKFFMSPYGDITSDVFPMIDEYFQFPEGITPFLFIHPDGFDFDSGDVSLEYADCVLLADETVTPGSYSIDFPFFDFSEEYISSLFGSADWHSLSIYPDSLDSISFDVIDSRVDPDPEDPEPTDPEPEDPAPSGDAPVADFEIIGIPGTLFWIAAGLLLLVIVLAVCGHAGGRRR